MRNLTLSESQFVNGSLATGHITLEGAITVGAIVGLMLAPGAIALLGYEFYLGTFSAVSIAKSGSLMIVGTAVATTELYAFLS